MSIELIFDLRSAIANLLVDADMRKNNLVNRLDLSFRQEHFGLKVGRVTQES